MAMSGMQTASTAGVSMSGVLAIFRNWEGDYCFPGTLYLPELLQELDGLFLIQLGSQPCFPCTTQLGALALEEAEQTASILREVRAPGYCPERRKYVHLP